MKKTLTIIIFFTLFVCETRAYDFEVNGLYYKKMSNNEVEVTSKPSGDYSGKLEIPEKVYYDGINYSVTIIGNYAFLGCNYLTSITIPNSVTSIGEGAFAYCSSLVSTTMPNSITSIGYGAFKDCSSLISITIPYGVKSIEYQTFAGCTNLTSITIPNSVVSIGNDVFANCSNLTSITIPNSVVRIGDDAFRECKGLTSITIPSSVTSIGIEAFYRCKNLSSIIIPNSVRSIGGYAFFECNCLTSITISNSVTSIGEGAFQLCANLIFIISEIETPFTIDVSVFAGISSEATLQVPKGTKSSYQQYSGWTQHFKEIIEESSEPKQQLDGHDYVDLGLPSGKLWATVNYGANQPEEFGNYVYWSSTDMISSSWGNSWITPTLTDVKELINKCTWTWGARNGINGYTIRGSNGNTIFLPAAGVKADKVSGVGSSVYYWTSTKATGSEYYLANIIMASPSDVGWGSLNTNFAQIPIRPVSKEGKAITTYSLSISASGNGYASYNGTSTRNQTRTFTVNEGTSATISFAPDNGYRIAKVLVNNTNVTSSVYNNQYTISNISANTTVSVTFEQIPPTTYTLSISASGNGYVSYNGTSTRNQTRTFTVNEGTSATISFAPDNGYKISSVKVNNADVTSQVTNSKYTISNITGNKTVSVVFVEEIKNMTYNGVNYRVTSSANRTVNVANGNYGYALTVPASFTYQSQQWQVTGIDADALSNELAAVIWNPSVVFPASISNPNFLLYVTSQQYAPSGIKNVIVNNTANSITLIDAASGNNFYCPRNFTAQYISYIHNYGMTTGINEARGWESIALPFDVKSITHSYKGSLVPFAKWSSQTDTKPFWLYELGSSGFVAASEIKANKPYIISMPNNSQYDDRYNVDGVVTFTATNATVKSSDNLQNGVFGEKTFIPNFVNGPSRSNIYVLNVVNSYSTHSGALCLLHCRQILLLLFHCGSCFSYPAR